MSANTRQKFIRRLSREQRERVRTDVSIPFVNRLRREQRPKAKEQLAAPPEDEPLARRVVVASVPGAVETVEVDEQGNIKPGTSRAEGPQTVIRETTVNAVRGTDRGSPLFTRESVERGREAARTTENEPLSKPLDLSPNITLPPLETPNLDLEVPEPDLSGLLRPLLILGAVLVGLLALSEFFEGAGKGVTS